MKGHGFLLTDYFRDFKPQEGPLCPLSKVPTTLNPMSTIKGPVIRLILAVAHVGLMKTGGSPTLKQQSRPRTLTPPVLLPAAAPVGALQGVTIPAIEHPLRLILLLKQADTPASSARVASPQTSAAAHPRPGPTGSPAHLRSELSQEDD